MGETKMQNSTVVNWTRLDLARVIVQALYNLDGPANINNPEVVRLARARKARLLVLRDQAVEVLHGWPHYDRRQKDKTCGAKRASGRRDSGNRTESNRPKQTRR